MWKNNIFLTWSNVIWFVCYEAHEEERLGIIDLKKAAKAFFLNDC